ncbi:uncharacterized protein LOC142879679 isoform X2 [Nelusetta ayraudi]|uniref:uncharacterized protein LOC142879679 isoform X2 n=1 Tax=Nelusetta ayraudi TaxID=303726 RepID=UPI003F706AA2
MGEFWKPLFVNLLLCTTAVVGQQKELLKKKGDNVYLPCTNVRRCDQIQWWFKAPWNPLLEQIPLPAPGSTLSNRKMLQEDCTLVLLGVQEVDAGYYMCTVMELEVVQIYLAVLTINELMENNIISVDCSISSTLPCPTVLFESSVRGLDLGLYDCYAVVKFPRSLLAEYYRRTSTLLTLLCSVGNIPRPIFFGYTPTLGLGLCNDEETTTTESPEKENKAATTAQKASGTTPPRWKRNFLYRNGTEQVILTCGNVTRTQRRDQFQWWFRFSQDSAWVQISRLQNKREIRRVDSALVLSRVHTEDVGLYICTEGAQELVQVHLGVVTVSEQLLDNKISLTCKVSTMRGSPCPPVVWLLPGPGMAFRSESSKCSGTLTFPSSLAESRYLRRLSLISLRCKVGNEASAVFFEYAIPGAASGGNTETTTKEDSEKEGNRSTGQKAPALPSGLDKTMLGLHVIEVLLVTVTTVLLFISLGKRRTPVDNTADTGVFYENGEDTCSATGQF